MRLVEIGAMNI